MTWCIGNLERKQIMIRLDSVLPIISATLNILINQHRPPLYASIYENPQSLNVVTYKATCRLSSRTVKYCLQLSRNNLHQLAIASLSSNIACNTCTICDWVAVQFAMYVKAVFNLTNYWHLCFVCPFFGAWKINTKHLFLQRDMHFVLILFLFSVHLN